MEKEKNFEKKNEKKMYYTQFFKISKNFKISEIQFLPILKPKEKKENKEIEIEIKKEYIYIYIYFYFYFLVDFFLYFFFWVQYFISILKKKLKKIFKKKT